LDEAGDDSVSDVDLIIFSLPTQHEIIGREIRYAIEIFALNQALSQEYFAYLIEREFGICLVSFDLFLWLEVPNEMVSI